MAESPRPIIYNYQNFPHFCREMLGWLRQKDSEFSIRNRVSDLTDCSPALVSQLANGQRKLTRDRVQSVSRLLDLSRQESRYLDQWVALSRWPKPSLSAQARADNQCPPSPTRPQNHIISHWLHPYIKEICKIKGFKPDPTVIHRMLRGIGTLHQIRHSLKFLLREGFLRRTLAGDIIQNEPLTATTDDIPDKKILAFHARALEIAKLGLRRIPAKKRRSETYILSLNSKNIDRLKQILINCMDQIEELDQECKDDSEHLMQVTLHMTPLTGYLTDESH